MIADKRTNTKKKSLVINTLLVIVVICEGEGYGLGVGRGSAGKGGIGGGLDFPSLFCGLICVNNLK